jgi:hypothetical protein
LLDFIPSYLFLAGTSIVICATVLYGRNSAWSCFLYIKLFL